MSDRFSRAVAALALVFGLWMSAIAAADGPLQQTQDQKEGAKAPAPASRQSTGRPLAINEDPRLIGEA